MNVIEFEQKGLFSLFGSENIVRILLFLLVNEKGYPTQVARLFNVALTPVQKAFFRLERGGLVKSEQVGKMRLYCFNPYFPLKQELEGLLKKAYTLLSPEQKRLYCYVGQIGETKMRLKLEATDYLWTRLKQVTRVAFKAQSREEQENGRQGEGQGKVILEHEDNKTLLFYEEGSWETLQNKTFAFSNTFRWRLIQSEGLVALEHLRFGKEYPVFLFHLVPTSKTKFCSLDSHLCADDSYMGQLHITPKEITFYWRIIGPKKNEELIYRYT